MNDMPDLFDFLGVKVRWTGWKGGLGTYDFEYEEPKPILDDVSYGQWICSSKVGGKFIYASYPGGEGRLDKGGLMDIEVKPGQNPVRHFERNVIIGSLGRADALIRLLPLLYAEAQELV